MERIAFETGPSPEISIRSASGDLRLSGWDHDEFQAEFEGEGSLDAEQSAGGIRVLCRSDCVIRVPRRASVTIGRVGGDARLKSLDGSVDLQEVGGDLVLRRAGPVSAGSVGGDVIAKRMAGGLRLHSARGDVSAQDLDGPFEAGDIGGDLYLRDVAGAARARVGGDARLYISFSAGQAYDFESGADIMCRIPQPIAATFTLHGGGQISVDLPEAQVEGSSGSKVVVVGDGGAPVALRAGGDITLTAASEGREGPDDFGAHFGEAFGAMADKLAARIESQMADFEQQLNVRLSNLGPGGYSARVDAAALAARARRAAERASEMARRKGEAMRRKAERAREKERRAAWKFARSSPPRPSPPPSEPVSEDERLAILRMLEKGQITVAEAEQLLAALDSP